MRIFRVYLISLASLICMIQGCRQVPKNAASANIDGSNLLPPLQLKQLWWLRSTGDFAVRGLSFSLDGHFLLSGWNLDVCRLWDANDYYRAMASFNTACLPKHEEGGTSVTWACPYSVVFSPNDRLALTGGILSYPPDHQIYAKFATENNAYLWDVGSRKLRFTLEGHTECVLNVAFSPDGKWALASSWDGTIGIWSVETGKLSRVLRAVQDNNIMSMSISPNGKLLAAGDGSGNLCVWTFPDSTEVFRTNIQDRSILNLVFSPDSRNLMICGGTNTVWRWDSQNHALRPLFKKSISPLWAAAFTPNGKYLIYTGARDYRLKDPEYQVDCQIWISDLSTGNTVCETPHLRGRVQRIAVSPNGKSFASGSNDGIKIWEIPSELDRSLQ